MDPAIQAFVRDHDIVSTEERRRLFQMLFLGLENESIKWSQLVLRERHHMEDTTYHQMPSCGTEIQTSSKTNRNKVNHQGMQPSICDGCLDSMP
ncbi:hypothetical protein CYMTET_6969 [Cymbomonas tetramitiformis]|uniref:Uncharacterized protein n=1 Tax=Cymbomonas tetramitiformis TaxID=36881 RepID=A0AAE0GVZ3_9CHLO|nr:hypothetical protein CYMTET_6969 [Cymbomonas tetramitiformis]